MANTYQLLGSYTAGSGGVATITFSSIPQTYTDLVLKFNIRGDSNSYREIWIYPNGSSANGSGKLIAGLGTSVSSSSPSKFEVADWSTPPIATANTFGIAEAYIANYASSNQKVMSSISSTETNGTESAPISVQSALWANTAAITSMDIVLAVSALFVQYSTVYLYGIKNS